MYLWVNHFEESRVEEGWKFASAELNPEVIRSVRLAVHLKNHVDPPLMQGIRSLANALLVTFEAGEPYLHEVLPLRFMTTL